MNIKHSLDNINCCEAYGILIGDGHLCKFIYKNRIFTTTIVTCNAKKDYVYITEHVTPLFNKLFQTNVTSRINNKRGVIEYITKKKDVFTWFRNNDFPVGIKREIGIPKGILNKSTKNIRAVIRGIFDTDGCVFARKDENYKYPYINISSHSQRLRLQLKKILRTQGYPAYIHTHNVNVRGINNFKKWFKEIGSNNPRIYTKYEEFLNTGQIIPNTGPVAQR